MLTKYFDLVVAVLYAPVYLTLVLIDKVSK
jgi:hypothetical protein